MQAFFSVFPAQAGMILVFAVIASPVSGIPRASGDDPNSLDSINYRRYVFPAQAGMIPVNAAIKAKYPRIPRASGDDPHT